MNKAAELVANSILNESFITVVIGGKPFTVYPPTIKVICRAVSSLSKIKIDGEYTKLSVIGEIPENIPHMIAGLSALIVGDVRLSRWKLLKMKWAFNSVTMKELREAWESIYPLIGSEDFFACALSMKSATGMTGKGK